MDLSIVIVSYNTADLIVPCLSSLEAAQGVQTEVFIIDNASADGSADTIRGRFPNVHLVANPINRGFAAANNQALTTCRGDFILFLNPDTQVMPDTFKNGLAYMRENPHIGLAGTKILNPDGTLQESVSYRYPGEKFAKGKLSSLKGHIACVLGAAMITRREVMAAVGGFNEDFFLYGEDEDLCLRIRKAGWEIGYIREACVVHLGGQSERLTLSAEKWRKKIRAEYLFYAKHYPPAIVSQIRRMDRWKARWRLLTIGISLPFLPDKRKAKEKQGRYRVILEETAGPR
jgi:N-acetylglucosaminyl-diphospho-decaprenol L-rhamnosyltransferase